MKLWLDDVRKPPDESYVWCKTAAEAFHLTCKHGPENIEFYLDHDLGGQLAHYGKGPYDNEAPTGLDFLKWFVEDNCPLKKVTIHSTNLSGVLQMMIHLYQEAVRLDVETEIIIRPLQGRIMDKTPYYEDR